MNLYIDERDSPDDVVAVSEGPDCLPLVMNRFYPAEMGQTSDLNAKQRTQLVLSLLSNEPSAAQIARQAGISPEELNRWREKFVDAGKQGDAEDVQARALQLRTGHITAVRASGEVERFDLSEEANKWLDEEAPCAWE